MSAYVTICYQRTASDGNFRHGAEDSFRVEDSELFGEDETIVDYLANYARINGYYTASSSPEWTPGTWYETGFYYVDFRTGEQENRTMHVSGLSDADAIALYARIVK